MFYHATLEGIKDANISDRTRKTKEWGLATTISAAAYLVNYSILSHCQYESGIQTTGYRFSCFILFFVSFFLSMTALEKLTLSNRFCLFFSLGQSIPGGPPEIACMEQKPSQWNGFWKSFYINQILVFFVTLRAKQNMLKTPLPK